MAKTKTNYVDNKQFQVEMTAYIRAFRKAKRSKEPEPRIPESIGKIFMLIAENMSHKYNFLSYTFRDDMVSDAIENCVRAISNYDYIKFKNPFAYFSQICYFAFITKIKKEKKLLYVKYKSTEFHGILDDFDQMDSGSGVTRQFDQYENISEFIEKFEMSQAAKKAKTKAKE